MRRKRWAAVLTMSCCCLAANDKATVQKQMTETQREVFAVGQANTAVSSAEPAADTGEPAAAVYSNNQTSIYIRLQQLMGKHKGKKIPYFHNVRGKKAKVISIR